MRFDLDQAFGISQSALLMRSKRAEIIASNLANADTPNYKARDIDFRKVLQDTLQESSPSKIAKTNPRHLSMGREVGGSNFELLYRDPIQPSIDGNTVDTQFEKAEFTQNAMQYQASLQFLGGRIKNLMTAIRGE